MKVLIPAFQFITEDKYPGCLLIKESGLVHVSNLANKYVSDVSEIVSLHQQVIVKVLEVDVARKRIQLSMNYK